MMRFPDELKFSAEEAQGVNITPYDVHDPSAHDHAFREIVCNAAQMMGVNPKWDVDFDKHAYTPEVPTTHDVKGLLGPVYDVLSQHNYHQVQSIVTDDDINDDNVQLLPDRHDRQGAEDPPDPGLHARVEEPVPADSQTR